MYAAFASIDAILTAANFLRLLEVECEQNAYVEALTADAATDRILEEQQTAEVRSPEPGGAEMIGAALRTMHKKTVVELLEIRRCNLIFVSSFKLTQLQLKSCQGAALARARTAMI